MCESGSELRKQAGRAGTAPGLLPRPGSAGALPTLHSGAGGQYSRCPPCSGVSRVDLPFLPPLRPQPLFRPKVPACPRVGTALTCTLPLAGRHETSLYTCPGARERVSDSGLRPPSASVTPNPSPRGPGEGGGKLPGCGVPRGSQQPAAPNFPQGGLHRQVPRGATRAREAGGAPGIPGRPATRALLSWLETWGGTWGALAHSHMPQHTVGLHPGSGSAAGHSGGRPGGLSTCACPPPKHPRQTPHPPRGGPALRPLTILATHNWNLVTLPPLEYSPQEGWWRSSRGPVRGGVSAPCCPKCLPLADRLLHGALDLHGRHTGPGQRLLE